jgi:hypothetical protein
MISLPGQRSARGRGDGAEPPPALSRPRRTILDVRSLRRRLSMSGGPRPKRTRSPASRPPRSHSPRTSAPALDLLCCSRESSSAILAIASHADSALGLRARASSVALPLTLGAALPARDQIQRNREELSGANHAESRRNEAYEPGLVRPGAGRSQVQIPPPRFRNPCRWNIYRWSCSEPCGVHFGPPGPIPATEQEWCFAPRRRFHVCGCTRFRSLRVDPVRVRVACARGRAMVGFSCAGRGGDAPGAGDGATGL